MIIRFNSLFAVHQKKKDILSEKSKVRPEDIIPADCCCCSSALNCSRVKMDRDIDFLEGFIDGTHMTDEQLKNVPADVISLSLDGANITDKGIYNLPFLYRIKSLNLSSTMITDKSIELISKFITIEKLWIDNVNLSGEYTLEPFKNLNFISFGGNGESEKHDYLSDNLGFRRT
jgi:hypothetical protein